MVYRRSIEEMTIYRAMCREEFEKTKLYDCANFIKRYKWFSPDLNFIITRVKDGKFYNSSYIRDRYQYICSFEWDGLNSDWRNDKEIQFDRRKNPRIIFKEYIGEII